MGAAPQLISAVGALTSAVHAFADASLLGAAIAVGCLPLQSPSVTPKPEAVRACVLGGMMSVPALQQRVTTAAGRLGKDHALWARITEQVIDPRAHAHVPCAHARQLPSSGARPRAVCPLPPAHVHPR